MGRIEDSRAFDMAYKHFRYVRMRESLLHSFADMASRKHREIRVGSVIGKPTTCIRLHYSIPLKCGRAKFASIPIKIGNAWVREPDGALTQFKYEILDGYLDDEFAQLIDAIDVLAMCCKDRSICTLYPTISARMVEVYDNLYGPNITLL